MNYLAPAGTPIRGRHLLGWIRNMISFSGGNKDLIKALKSKFGKKHIFMISSGRTALYLILKNLYSISENSERNEVIIPSYTCFSVPGSIAKAGLKIRICDIDTKTLNYDINELQNIDYSKVLAIVTSNLYGIPNDLSAIEELSKEKNIFLVDDAAQSMGAKIDNRYCGTFGDVGLFSLDKGKNITSIQGGVILTDSEDIASKLESELASIPSQSTIGLVLDCIKLVIYALLLPPSRYWIITKIPLLKLGTTPYTTDYPVHKYSNILAKFISVLFSELDQLSNQRRINAENIKRAISPHEQIEFIHNFANSEPVYVRLPALVKDQALKEKLINRLEKSGIGATGSYPTAVSDIVGIEDLLKGNIKPKNGNMVASLIVTLPCNPYLTEEHIAIMKKIVNETIY